MLLADLRNLYRKDLADEYPEAESDQVFYNLLDHYLGLPRFILGVDPGRFLSRAAEDPMLEALHRLKNHEPVQYITGKAHFMGMELQVTPAVLIPRPETEGLVRWVLEAYPGETFPKRVLDAGTGSGCIALALAREWIASELFAVDASAEALAVARQNAREQELDVAFLQGDMCQPEALPGPFDLIVSNPPYIPRADALEVQARVRKSEPEQALFVPDAKPLKFYSCLLDAGRRRLSPGGALYVETHHSLAGEVASHFRQAGYVDIRVKKDIFGKERYVCGSLRGALA